MLLLLKICLSFFLFSVFCNIIHVSFENFLQKASDLFDILSNKSFRRHDDLGKKLRCLLNYLQSDNTSKTFSPKLHSTIITDASPSGIGAILEREC